MTGNFANSIAGNTKPRLPFSPWLQRICPSPRRYVQQLILSHNLRTGLDMGCGTNSLLSPLRSSSFRSAGLDAFSDAIEKSRRLNLHDEYIHADLRSYTFDRKFDVVVACNVIEHLTREEAMGFLQKMEFLAERIVYLEVPYGFLEQTAFDGNPHQRHFSGWFPHDFVGRGYTVFGMGLRGLRGVQGGSRFLPEPIVRTIDRSLAWLVFRRPYLAFYFAAIKYIDENGDIRMV